MDDAADETPPSQPEGISKAVEGATCPSEASAQGSFFGQRLIDLFISKSARSASKLEKLNSNWEKLFEGVSPKRHTGPDKIDVLFIGHEATLTGAPIVLHELIQELVRVHPINPHVILLSDGPLLDKYKESAPVLILSKLNELTGSQDASVRLLADYFATIPGPKAVLANTIAIDRMFCDVFAEKNIPYLVWIHEMAQTIRTHFGSTCLNYLAEQATTVIFASSLSYRENVSSFGLKEHNLIKVECGIRLQKGTEGPAIARKQIREKLNIPQNGPLVLACGSIEHRKGTDLFVQAAVQYFSNYSSPEGPQAHFVWVGRTLLQDFFDNLMADIKQAGLHDRIHFVGQQSNPHVYFRASDVFLFTSRTETLGLVAVEAMAHKIPVVGFENATGAAEYVAQGFGSLVSYPDTCAMAGEIHAYLTKQKSIRDDGYQFIEEKFSISRLGERFHQELKTAVHAQRRT